MLNSVKATATVTAATGKSRNWVYNLTYKTRVLHVYLLLLFLFTFYLVFGAAAA